MGWRGQGSLIARVRLLFTEPAGPQTALDMGNVRLVGAIFWLIGGVIAAALLPFAPPTQQIGWAGWVIASLSLLMCFAIARRRLNDRHMPTLNEIYLSGWLGLAMIAALEWLAGGRGSPYHELYVLPALYAGAIHGPRRAIGFLLAVMAAACLPLLYAGRSQGEVVDVAAQLLMLIVLALTARGLILAVRIGRGRLRQAREDAEQRAREDPLTGLPNRLAFQETIGREVARATRTGRPISLALGDIDNFKAVNDTFGHLSGDQCLVSIARALDTGIRRSEQCFRWGGDEFAVLLIDADPEGAERARERICALVSRECQTPAGEPLRMVCATTSLVSGQGPEDLLLAADQALTRLKASSRSAVV